MFASTNPSPGRSLTFAAVYFLGGVLALIACLRTRGRSTYRNGIPTSLATQAALIFMFFLWGACSLGDARGWTFLQRHSLLLHFGSVGLVAAGFGLDLLREYLPSARVIGDRRALRISLLALIAVSVLLGIWCVSVLM